MNSILKRSSVDLTESPHVLGIWGIPKEVTCSKLKSILESKEKREGAWKLQLISLENWDMAHVYCSNDDILKRLLTIKFARPILNADFKMKAISEENILPISSVLHEDAASLLHLNFYCLRHIFDLCELKEQLVLAKVCQQFYAVVADIWRRKYKYFYYSWNRFENELFMDENEIRDFCMIVGRFSEKLVFNSIFYFPLIQRHLKNSSGNLMKNAKALINVNFCKNLVYFENVEIFEVQGKFLSDFTVEELARYCPRLRVFRLLDVDTCGLTGKHFDKFINLQELCIRDCANFERRRLSKICIAVQLKHLNIVECTNLQKARFVQDLCGSLGNLQILKLTALADASMLAAILQLRSLKVVQFYWLNDYEDFENLLIDQLRMHSRRTLVSLKFDNNRAALENESQQTLNPFHYALFRENVTIAGRPWQWNGKFKAFGITFANFQNLKTITCHYCRPFSDDNMLRTAKECPSLSQMELVGCQDRNDSSLLTRWRQMQLEDNVRCCLSIDGLIPGPVVMNLRHHAEQLPYRSVNYGQVLRSIECQFESSTQAAQN